MLDPTDTSIPHAARIHDALLGGKDNYEVDRAVATALTRVIPELPLMVRAQRALLRRVVSFLVRNAGLRQLLDLGTGIPATPNVHEIAQAIAPETRVVYVDNDPFALAHARALLRSGRGGRTAVVEADLRDPEAVLDARVVGDVLDRTRPIGVLLIGVLHRLRPSDDAAAAVRRLVDAIPPGSWVAIAALASDLESDLVGALVGVAGRHGLPVTPRSRHEVARPRRRARCRGAGHRPTARLAAGHSCPGPAQPRRPRRPRLGGGRPDAVSGEQARDRSAVVVRNEWAHDARDHRRDGQHDGDGALRTQDADVLSEEARSAAARRGRRSSRSRRSR